MLAEIKYRLDGRDCTIAVNHYEHLRGTYKSCEETPYEYFGYTEMDWEVLNDRKQRIYIPCSVTRCEIEDVIHRHFGG